MKLSPHFSLEEMTRSQTATRYGIDNDPSDSDLVNLVYTCQLLEQVRSLCGDNSIHVSSGYRCPDLNMRIGGARHSAHMEGRAADFTIPGYGSVDAVIDVIRGAGVPYRKVIKEFGRWVHIEAHPLNVGEQGEALLARLQNGKTVYEVVT